MAPVRLRGDLGTGDRVNGLNVVMLIGNLGRDAELRYTPGGAAVATVNLAVTESWNDQQGRRQERTEWIRVVLWGKVAEALHEHLIKGKQIHVTGKLQTRKWTDKDGVERFTTEIRADKILLLGGGPRREPNGGHVPDEQVGGAGDPGADPPLDQEPPF